MDVPGNGGGFIAFIPMTWEFSMADESCSLFLRVRIEHEKLIVLTLEVSCITSEVVAVGIC
jgi:hypothetical protein